MNSSYIQKITNVSISLTYEVPHKHKMNPVKHVLSVLSGIIHLFTFNRLLVCFVPTGFVITAIGFILVVQAFSIAARTSVWATTMTLAAAMMLLMGMLFISVSLILFSISRMVAK